MVQRNPRNNFYDGQKVTLEDLKLEQAADNRNVAFTNEAILGGGVLLESPVEPVIFDSDAMSAAQQGFAAVNTFDGRGVLDSVYNATDPEEGKQISVTYSGARINSSIPAVCTIIGKLFDDQLKYEHLIFAENGTRVTRNHFKEITNVMFQNTLGNTNIVVDGIRSFNTIGAVDGHVRGRVVVSEASSYKVSHDCIATEQVSEPDIIFRDYKVYDPGKTLDEVIQEAVGSANDPDDLDINTTVALQRKFEAGGSTETIYAQKFKMVGNSIQKISLLLGLESGTTWTGSLVIGVRPLLTSTNSPTDYLPDNEIEFDPDSVPLEEVSLNQAQLEELGFVLGAKTMPVDFIFSDTQLSNPSLSGLVDGDYYVITIRRTGSSATGTILLDEARNNTPSAQRLTVFSGGSWTDVEDSTLWYTVWTDSVKVASGVAFDAGVRLPIAKTALNASGELDQNFIEDIGLVDTSEGVENYLIVQKGETFSAQESHPRTGDQQYSQVEDTPSFRILSQAELLALLVAEPKTVPLARVKDNNARSNPTISGLLKHPGLALGNTISIVDPPSDLLVHNVVGSVITPDTLNPTIKYRIVSQSTETHLLGDVNGDGVVDVLDAARLDELDGYHIYGDTTTTYTSASQKSMLESGQLDILQVIRAELDSSDGYEITSSDLNALNNYIDDGTAFPIGKSSFTVVKLTVEPLINAVSEYDSDAISTVSLETDNGDLVDPANFDSSSGLTFSIQFIPKWNSEQVQVLDLRRFVTTTFLDFSSEDIINQPENGGLNNLYVPGALYLQDNVKNLDGSFHKLDMEINTIEIDLPAGNSEGELNIFEEYIVDKMKFSDGTLVSAEAINKSQVRFEVAVGSHVKNVSGDDGYLDFDGYNDGYGANADEAIGTYIDHDTGLLRIRAFNIVRNEFFPELRSRILITVSLKKAGFTNSVVTIDSTTLSNKLRQFAP